MDGMDPPLDPEGESPEKDGADMQSHCHVHALSPVLVSEVGDIALEPLGDTTGGAAADCAGGAARGSVWEELPSAAVAVVVPEDVSAAATLTCVTAPSSPGLPIRTLTLTFAGEDCVALGAGETAAGVVSEAVSA